MENKYPAIQQLCIRLAGFFEYDISISDEKLIADKFTYDRYYEDNTRYFNGKYYPNWLKTLYPQNEDLKKRGLPFLDGNRLIYKQTAEIGVQELIVKGGKQSFTINRIDIFLFRENHALFSIDISPMAEYYNFNDLTDFVNAARHTGKIIHNNLEQRTPIIKLLEENVLPVFRGSINWDTYNPNLKLFINADLEQSLAVSQDIDHLLFELATASPIGSVSANQLYSPSAGYYEKIIKHNTISVFNNWKTICLSDSMVRVSINLKNEDTHRLWDNDYYAIYIFVLFIRFYLYRTNELLSNNLNTKKTADIKESYMEFMNEFDLTQISYKFLPNEIYKKMLSSLSVTEELEKLNQKIERIDNYKKEIHEKRMKNLEMYFIVGGAILVSWEGSELINLLLFGSENHHHHRQVAIIWLIIVVTLAFGVYRFYGKKTKHE